MRYERPRVLMACYEKPALPCHSERSEESADPLPDERVPEILRCAQNDTAAHVCNGLLSEVRTKNPPRLKPHKHSDKQRHKQNIQWKASICQVPHLYGQKSYRG